MRKTKKEMFNEMLLIDEIANNPEMVEFINHEIELLNKKSGSTKTSAKQVLNNEVKNEIISILENAENSMTITEIVKNMEAEYSNQKISALVRQLTNDGVVVREMEKKVAKFSIA